MSRPRKDWIVTVKYKKEKKGSFKGENLIEALAAAEEQVLYVNEDGTPKEGVGIFDAKVVQESA